MIIRVIMLTVTFIDDTGLAVQSSLPGRELPDLYKRSRLPLLGSLYRLFNGLLNMFYLITFY